MLDLQLHITAAVLLSINRTDRRTDTVLLLGILIPGKSHSRDESRKSRVLIETLDFARVRTFACVIGVGSPAGVRRGRAITGRNPAPFPDDDGTPSPPYVAEQLADIAGGRHI